MLGLDEMSEFLSADSGKGVVYSYGASESAYLLCSVWPFYALPAFGFPALLDLLSVWPLMTCQLLEFPSHLGGKTIFRDGQ